MNTKETKSLKQKKQQQQQKKNRQTIIGAVALLLVVALLFGGVLVVRHTGVLLRRTVAATTTNRTLDKAMLTYYFNTYLTEYVNDRLSYIEDGSLNLNLRKPLTEQTYDGKNTWYSYFANKASESVRRDLLLAEAATADGVTLTEQEKQAAAAEVAEKKPSAYGTGLKQGDILACVELQMLAEKYLAAKSSDLYGNEADWEAAYKAEPLSYATVDYKYIEIPIQLDGEKQEKRYEELLAQTMESGNPEGFDKGVRKMFKEFTAYADMEIDDVIQEGVIQGKYYTENSDLDTWLFDKKTKLYDTYLQETDQKTQMYMITRTMSPEMRMTRNYSNILISGTDKDVRVLQAENLLKEWQAGEATLSSFGALAREHSKDAHSAENNGQYINVIQQRADSETVAWLFAAERKAGDVTVIDTSRGAQVLYYEGVGVPYWQVLARQNTYNKRYEALLNELEKTYALALEDAVLQSVQGKAMVG